MLTWLTCAYDAMTWEQLQDGVVERAPAEVTAREFYLPHHLVVKKDAETTKMHMVSTAHEQDGVL